MPAKAPKYASQTLNAVYNGLGPKFRPGSKMAESIPPEAVCTITAATLATPFMRRIRKRPPDNTSYNIWGKMEYHNASMSLMFNFGHEWFAHLILDAPVLAVRHIRASPTASVFLEAAPTLESRSNGRGLRMRPTSSAKQASQEKAASLILCVPSRSQKSKAFPAGKASEQYFSYASFVL